jgi:hypothetical protein
MFGYVTASVKELTPEQKTRYNAVYCGICRRIRVQSSQIARLGLSYDMAFLAMLLMSLYEPEDTYGKWACGFHPIVPRPWVDNEFVAYAADMNVALGYFKALDDWQDDKSLPAKWLSGALGRHGETIEKRYPRQWEAISRCIRELSALEKENCPNPDLPAGCFGALMGELLVYKEDLWAPTLRKMGQALGRFIYLADGVSDYDRDKRKGKYNPFFGADTPPALREEALVLAMARCTAEFEKLPLVQDKKILDNILYSGVWCSVRGKKQRKEAAGDERSL